MQDERNTPCSQREVLMIHVNSEHKLETGTYIRLPLSSFSTFLVTLKKITFLNKDILLDISYTVLKLIYIFLIL